MKSSPCSQDAATCVRGEAPWPVAGLFLDALARRDFAALTSCLRPDVRFRGLIPPGPFEITGAVETASRFEQWFGGEDDFEILDASVGQFGPLLYLRWRVRMSSAGDPSSGRLVEQHAFSTAGAHIQSLDLLCSGFHDERSMRPPVFPKNHQPTTEETSCPGT